MLGASKLNTQFVGYPSDDPNTNSYYVVGKTGGWEYSGCWPGGVRSSDVTQGNTEVHGFCRYTLFLFRSEIGVFDVFLEV